MPDFPMVERMAMEKEMTGLYITGHPLNTYREAIKALKLVKSSELRTKDDDEEQEGIELRSG